MTQLYFRYSEIYEYMLSRLSGEKLSPDLVQDGHTFAQKYANHWKQYNDAIFEYYKGLGFEMADFWIAYFVHLRKNLTPFSDPLTLFIKDDLDQVSATLVHELAHVVLSYGPNIKLEQELWNHVQSVYPDHDFGTNIEIMTILLARGGLNRIFGADRTEVLLAKEKNYLSLQKSWQIIDAQPEVLDEPNPIEAIYRLKKLVPGKC